MPRLPSFYLPELAAPHRFVLIATCLCSISANEHQNGPQIGRQRTGLVLVLTVGFTNMVLSCWLPIPRTQLPTIFSSTHLSRIVSLISAPAKVNPSYEYPRLHNHFVAYILVAVHRIPASKNSLHCARARLTRSDATPCICQRPCSSLVDGFGLKALLFLGGAEFRFGVSLGTGGNDSGLKPHSIFDIGELLGKPEATEYFSYGSTIPTCLLSYPLWLFADWEALKCQPGIAAYSIGFAVESV